MLPKLDNSSALPVVATAMLRNMANMTDPRLDATARLDQIALAKTTPGQLAAQLVDAAALTPEQAAALVLAGPTPSDKTTLSAAARLIDSLLQSSVAAQLPKTLTATQPLLAKVSIDNPPQASQLGPELQKALAQSGVFYESHLKQWSYGERSLTQLQAEPQNQPGALPAEASQWVPLQLDLHEQQRFSWQGQPWPGQTMRWQVQEDSSGSAHPDEGAPQAAWNSVLQLDFPGLGKVSVKLRLVGEHVQVQLRAQEETAVAALKTQSESLSHSLAAAGTTLDGLTVQFDELG